jgi:hypothetical protein
MIIPQIEAPAHIPTHSPAHSLDNPAAHPPTHAHASEHTHSQAPAHASTPSSETPFRLSPPEPRPEVFREPPILEDPAHPERYVYDEEPSQFELIEEDDGSEPAIPASPEIQRGVQALAEFQKDQRPYTLADEPGRRSFFRWDRDAGPAGWLRVKWRAGVTFVLRLLRWVDDWAYLISVPFIVLAIFGIAVENRSFVHAGAVVVVLANFGRFWADLLAVFVRPFQEGPVHGLAFLFPPYGVYYLATRWDRFEPTLRRMITSCIPIVLVILAYAFLPSVNPAVKDAQGVRARIRSGVEELRTEIRDDVRQLEKGLPPLEDPDKAVSQPKP